MEGSKGLTINGEDKLRSPREDEEDEDDDDDGMDEDFFTPTNQSKSNGK